MRRLNTMDLIRASKVIKSLKITEEIKEIAVSLQNGQFSRNDVEALGIRMLFATIGNLGETASEKTLFEFLSGPLEVKPEEVAEIPLLDLGNKVIELIHLEDLEAWKAFFKQLADILPKIS